MSKTREGIIYDGSEVHEGLYTDAVVDSSKVTSQSYDVVVIGSGFTGLVAARDLSRNTNLKILLLEARDRIGGRTWTSKAWGEEFEMGGTWIHWTQPYVFVEASRHGLHTGLKTSAGLAELHQMIYKPRGAPAQTIDKPEAERQLDILAADFFTMDGIPAYELMPFPHEPLSSPPQEWTKYDYMSVRDRLNQMDVAPELKDQLEALFNCFGCSTGNETAFSSALQWYVLGGCRLRSLFAAVGAFKLPGGGMTNLAKHILAEFKGDRLFNTPVKAIRQNESEVKIVCQGDLELSAKRVICTIPLNCLSDVEFVPPLSALRQEAVQKGHINAGAKIHYHVNETQPGWFAITADKENSDMVFALSDHNGTQGEEQSGTFCIGFGFTGQLPNPKDHEAVVAALKTLQADTTVKGYLTHDWAHDPFAKGTWWCGGPDMATKYTQELQQPHGRIIMASSDWADGWRSFVDGAIEQGSRAAARVAKLMREGSKDANSSQSKRDSGYRSE